MDTNWNNWLREQAEIAEEQAQHSTKHLEQIDAFQHHSVIAVQSGFKVIQVSGEDAQIFLQNQLSSDIREVQTDRAQYSTYSNAKGRMLASFLIWAYQQDYYLLIAADLAESILKRLSMFVLRAKVKLRAVDHEWQILGLSGQVIEKVISTEFLSAKEKKSLEVQQSEGQVLISLPGQGYLLAAGNNASLPSKLQLSESINFISQNAWSLRDIDAGIPWICQATQEQFVAQMANMDLLGAVSFKKGCYPGQEIVARTQYLGKIKRRLFKIALAKEMPVGTKLFGHEVAGQSIGMLVAICQISPESYTGLAVVQSLAWENGIYADEQLTIPLHCLELPYSLTSEPLN
ncbi:folate-binding protein [Neisseriaceae bacterium TC5R-5]|nr:folate-binding protein [Neisseriaceae bacterium TC5R-5]